MGTSQSNPLAEAREKYGYVRMFDHLRKLYPKKALDVSILKAAAIGGHLPMIKYLLWIKCPVDDSIPRAFSLE